MTRDLGNLAPGPHRAAREPQPHEHRGRQAPGQHGVIQVANHVDRSEDVRLPRHREDVELRGLAPLLLEQWDPADAHDLGAADAVVDEDRLVLGGRSLTSAAYGPAIF